MKSFKTVVSYFDGMSCAQLALKRAGISVGKYYAAEVDKYAIKIAQKNFPDTIQLGDVTTIDLESLGEVDLLIGGSPCQGFSFAGKGLNFDDPRSKLFFEFVKALNTLKPRYFLLENVKMKKEYQDVISSLLGVEPIEINSSLVSSQNRKRLYWSNIPGITQPKDKNISWKDVRQKGLNEFYYTDKGMQWLARSSQKRVKTLDIWSDDEKAQMVEASHFKNYSNQRFFGVCDFPSSDECIAAIRGRYTLSNNNNKTTQQYIEFRHDERSNCLTTVRKDNVVVPFTLPNKIPKDEFFFRYISVVECERLQTVPDNYTEGVSNTQRYKMLGNGFTVDVIAHILSHIKF